MKSDACVCFFGSCVSAVFPDSVSQVPPLRRAHHPHDSEALMKEEAAIERPPEVCDSNNFPTMDSVIRKSLQAARVREKEAPRNVAW